MAGDILQTILLRQGRNIGGIVPNVVIEEHHQDVLTITDHPVERGPQVSDHAFKNPAEVSMRLGWSNSSLALTGVISGIVSGTLLTGGGVQSVGDVYEQLLKLQESRVPFDVVTGKRSYTGMLIKALSVTTDRDSETALLVTVHLRQVILVQTVATTLKPEVQAKPQQTTPLQKIGSVQPKPVPQSSGLYKLFGGGS